MNRLCKVAITCPGPEPGLEGDSPVSNYTAELPDTISFEGFAFPIFDQNNTIGGTDTTGPFPPWLAFGCQSFCLSFVSADDASACAARAAFICAHKKTTGPDPTFFFNSQQSCPFTCPDGTLYVYTVLPGYFVALSQAEADFLAQNLACQRAIANHVCLGNFAGGVCSGARYNSTIQLFGVYPLSVEVVSGQLPPGILLSQDFAGKTATLSGTCQVPGSYQFALMATDPNGNFHVKNYTINVLGIPNAASVPAAVENTPYSFQLSAVGGTAPFTYSLASGSLDGLTLSPSGLISGTPPYATAKNFPFTVVVTDATGLSCSQSGNLKVNLRPGPDWTQLTWPFFGFIQNPPNFTAAGSASSNTGNGNLQNTQIGFLTSISPAGSSIIKYTGPDVICRCRVTISASSGNTLIALVATINGVGGNISNLLNKPPGTYDFDFHSGLKGSRIKDCCASLTAAATLEISSAHKPMCCGRLLLRASIKVGRSINDKCSFARLL